MKRTLVAVAVGALGAIAFGVPARAHNVTVAQAEPDCKTTVTYLNRPDHGHGTVNGGFWANLKITRTTKICVVPVDNTAKLVAPPATVHYKATVKDEGTFITIAGTALSPNDAKLLVGGVHGTVVGSFSQDFLAAEGWLYYQGAMNGKTYNGAGNPVSTSNWVSAVWGGDDFKSDGMNDDWIWTYKTCSEQWVDSSAAANEDGASDSAGDIIGKPCASASPSPSASPSTSVKASASATPLPTSFVPAGGSAGSGSLPVTGSKVTVIVGFGAVLVALGAGLFLASRRRNKSEFIIE